MGDGRHVPGPLNDDVFGSPGNSLYAAFDILFFVSRENYHTDRNQVSILLPRVSAR